MTGDGPDTRGHAVPFAQVSAAWRRLLLRQRWAVAGELCDSLLLGLLAHERGG